MTKPKWNCIQKTMTKTKFAVTIDGEGGSARHVCCVRPLFLSLSTAGLLVGMTAVVVMSPTSVIL